MSIYSGFYQGTSNQQQQQQQQQQLQQNQNQQSEFNRNNLPVGNYQQQLQLQQQQQAQQVQQQQVQQPIQVDDEVMPSPNSTSTGVTGNSTGKRPAAVGGRPKDKVWDLFDGDKDSAKCHHCTWKTDHPKAFRMRAHVLNCDAIPQELKDRLESWQASKDESKKSSSNNTSTNAKDENVDELINNGVGSGSPVKKIKREREPAIPKPVGKSPITCHVLDSTSGKPAPEMRIRLERLNTTGFALLANGITDNDGRCLNLLPVGEKVQEGIFKITFFSSEYFTKRGILSFYPFVEVPFEVKSAEEHYHIPLLLSPYAYSTYRGS